MCTGGRGRDAMLPRAGLRNNSFFTHSQGQQCLPQSAINFIESQAKSKTPFFLQVSHYAVHSDIMMRKETLKKYLKIQMKLNLLIYLLL